MLEKFSNEFIAQNKEYFDFVIVENLKFLGWYALVYGVLLGLGAIIVS